MLLERCDGLNARPLRARRGVQQRSASPGGADQYGAIGPQRQTCHGRSRGYASGGQERQAAPRARTARGVCAFPAVAPPRRRCVAWVWRVAAAPPLGIYPAHPRDAHSRRLAHARPAAPRFRTPARRACSAALLTACRVDSGGAVSLGRATTPAAIPADKRGSILGRGRSPVDAP
eukprot:359094-Chlamydomonas_euryale.AAC.18